MFLLRSAVYSVVILSHIILFSECKDTTKNRMSKKIKYAKYQNVPKAHHTINPTLGDKANPHTVPYGLVWG